METLLRYDNVTISYSGHAVVRDVSFGIAPGEILGIVGESGSGKTTLIKGAMGLLGSEGMVTGGDIWFQGYNLPDTDEKTMRRLRGAQLGMIFQDPSASLCPVRTVGSQIYESMAAHRKLTLAEARAEALALFDKLSLRDGERIWRSYPFELSGGMNQRVTIAIAILMRTSVLLADEPTSALDVAAQKQVITELLRMRQLFGTAIVLVTHDIGVVSAMADRVLVLRGGEVMEYGSARQVLGQPRHAYTRSLLAAVPRIRREA